MTFWHYYRRALIKAWIVCAVLLAVIWLVRFNQMQPPIYQEAPAAYLVGALLGVAGMALILAAIVALPIALRHRDRDRVD